MRKYIALIFVFVISNMLYSGDFTASVRSTTVNYGDNFEVSFSLNNGKGTDFRPPNFKGFSVLSGPNQSFQTQIINGRMSQSQSYNFVLKADVEGKFTIQPASIIVNGEKLTSNSLTINVVKGASSQQQQKQSNSGGDLNQQANSVISKNLFLRLNVNKTSAYLGEPIYATYKLYIHPDLQLVNYSIKLPVFNGFWTQEINIGQAQFKREMLDGVMYNVADLKEVVLLPQQSGNLTIEPVESEFVVRLRVQNKRRSNDPFEDFFSDSFFGGGYQDFPYKARTKSASVTVKAFPEQAPDDFKGAVGNLQFKAFMDKTNCKTNEAVSLKIQISGNGNLKLLDPLPVKLPPDIESYEPKATDNSTVTASGISGSKTFEYLLIPRNAGEFHIEPIKFTYFDLSSKRFVTLTSDEFVLTVEKGSDADESVISGVRKEDVKLLGKDIRFIKTNAGDIIEGGGSTYGAMFFIMLALPWLLFAVLFFYKKKQDELHKDEALFRNKKANKIAAARLSAAKKYLQSHDSDNFYNEILKAMWGYFGDKLKLPQSELNKENIINAFINFKITEELASRAVSILNNCEFARYSPALSDEDLAQTYEEAVNIISEMERKIK